MWFQTIFSQSVSYIFLTVHFEKLRFFNVEHIQFVNLFFVDPIFSAITKISLPNLKL